MGQYHILVNLTKKEFVTPGGLGLGSKQAEHLDMMGKASYLLTMVPEARGGGDLMPSGNSFYFIGSWMGDRIAVVGDYTCDDDLPDFPGFGEIYHKCMINSNPMYDCYGLRNSDFRSGSKFKPDNLWRDITSDLAIEIEEAYGIKVIPFDHPTLWPDGQRRPEELIKSLKEYKKTRIREIAQNA